MLLLACGWLLALLPLGYVHSVAREFSEKLGREASDMLVKTGCSKDLTLQGKSAHRCDVIYSFRIDSPEEFRVYLGLRGGTPGSLLLRQRVRTSLL